MTQEEVQDIRDTYEAAAEAVGLPDGWWVQVHTGDEAVEEMEGMGALGMEDELSRIVMPSVVDDSGIAHIVAEHTGPVKQVHAERNLERGVREHQ